MILRTPIAAPLACTVLALALLLRPVAPAAGRTDRAHRGRRLSAALRVHFAKATEAANRAVMADTDDASVAAAREAQEAAAAVERDVEQLRPMLRSLGLRRRAALPRGVHRALRRVPADRRGDPAAGGREHQHQGAAPAVRSARAARPTRSGRRWPTRRGRRGPPPSPRREMLAARATAALLDMQLLLARHIARGGRRGDDCARRPGSRRRSSGARRAGRAAGEHHAIRIGAPRGRRRGVRSLPRDQPRDRHALAAQQQRAVAGPVARPEADRDDGVRRAAARPRAARSSGTTSSRRADPARRAQAGSDTKR